MNAINEEDLAALKTAMQAANPSATPDQINQATHVANLIAAGFLAVSRKAKCGPDGSAFIIRASYENFLIGRLQ